jgi:ankyrin repeat protein
MANLGQELWEAACILGERTVTESLLNKGANIEHEGGWGRTPHHRGANVHVRDNSGENALMNAVQNGHADVATFLVTWCGAEVNAVNNNGFTALHWAAQEGFLDIVKMLHTHGADVHALTNRGHNAHHHGKTKVVRRKGPKSAKNKKVDIDFHKQNEDGYNALMLAAGKGHLSIVAWLAGQGKL